MQCIIVFDRQQQQQQLQQCREQLLCLSSPLCLSPIFMYNASLQFIQRSRPVGLYSAHFSPFFHSPVCIVIFKIFSRFFTISPPFQHLQYCVLAFFSRLNVCTVHLLLCPTLNTFRNDKTSATVLYGRFGYFVICTILKYICTLKYIE